jgi:hypothetical protein
MGIGLQSRGNRWSSPEMMAFAFPVKAHQIDLSSVSSIARISRSFLGEGEILPLVWDLADSQ